MREPSLYAGTYLGFRHDLHAGELAGVIKEEQAHRVYYRSGRVYIASDVTSRPAVARPPRLIPGKQTSKRGNSSATIRGSGTARGYTKAPRRAPASGPMPDETERATHPTRLTPSLGTPFERRTPPAYAKVRCEARRPDMSDRRGAPPRSYLSPNSHT